MTTDSGVRGDTARIYSQQMVHYVRKTVNYNDTNIGTADSVVVGYLPANAEIVDVKVNVLTAFNAATTNVLTVGTSSGSDADIVGAGDVDESTTGVYSVTKGWGLSLTADTKIYAKYTQTGTAATTGKARILISYIPSNDQ